jgi:hypothetical protein
MDEQTSLMTAGSGSEESFELAVRGYSRPQVQQYVTRTTVRIRDLEEQNNALQNELEQARAAALQAHRELAEARASAGAKPAHEEVSGRLSQILRLAAEEADQERAKADEEITAARRLAEEQVNGLVAEARQQSERIISEARSEAENTLGSANLQAEHQLTTSRTESERLLAQSKADSERMLTDADRRASAVNEESATRLDALTETHGEVVRRLAQIRDVLGDLLTQDASAGSLAAAVDAALGLPLGQTAEPKADATPDGETPQVRQGQPAQAIAAAAEPVAEPAAEPAAEPVTAQADDDVVDVAEVAEEEDDASPAPAGAAPVGRHGTASVPVVADQAGTDEENVVVDLDAAAARDRQASTDKTPTGSIPRR